MWYEELGFEEDPYQATRSPMLCPFERITWNRDDLEQRGQVTEFIESVVGGRRVGLKVYGASGSGKTWMLRYLQKQIEEDGETEPLVIHVGIPRMDPTFSAFYLRFTGQMTPHLTRIAQAIESEAGPTVGDWSRYLGDENLAQALYHIKSEDKHADIANRWLRVEKLSATELRDADIYVSLDRSYRMHEVFTTLVQQSLLAFSTTTLMVDELGHIPPSLAKKLGESLRELLDGFYDRFSLVCTYTARVADEMYDLGYNEFLYRRLEYEIQMQGLDEEYAPTFLRKHHECYRSPEYEPDDQLLPFEESGIARLIEIMAGEHRYPAPILTNCGILARAATEQATTIDATFVDEHSGRLREMASGRLNM